MARIKKTAPRKTAQRGKYAGKGPTKAGQPLAAFDKQRKPAAVASRRVRGAQRAEQKRQQKRRDSR